MGYGTGAGGTVTQATSKSTNVTLDKPCGQITLNASALLPLTAVVFTLTNSLIQATDLLLVQHTSGGTAGGYRIDVNTMANGSCKIVVINLSSVLSLSEALVLTFAIFKASIS